MSEKDKSNDRDTSTLSPDVDITEAVLGSDEMIAKGKEDDIKSAKFFAKMDAELNKGIIDIDEKVVADMDKKEAAHKTQDLKEDTQQLADDSDPDDVNTLKKRYSDSSKEAKRLKGELDELKPYMPILDAMKEDPGLISHVRGYFEGGGSTPQSVIESMGLDEDFDMDMREALSDPNSDSAKVFNATVENIVQTRLSQALARQQQVSTQQTVEEQFKREHGLTEEEFKSFKADAQKKKLTIDDLWYLYNREHRDEKIAKDVSKKTIDKIREVQNRPSSLGNRGSEKQPDKSSEDKIMDALVEMDKRQDILSFGD